MSDTAADDPKPQPPQPPQPGDCCHSGCTFCVEDMYQDELDRYRAALKAWQERHPGHG
ncbi:oxidoreductase-like domain-containing protein [Rugamonas aquatica]|uniref:Oxidoreductase-like protein n=1 Tax=Rugamonas aquatica TaxID=2743357 RepID=A0A6A7N498_9BURK|nr:oxidoreductase-like domain-containing protein [Rugamonas aquatica]MQA39856.1 oxidoreductase-like protein [Rugamonas aquatica]